MGHPVIINNLGAFLIAFPPCLQKAMAPSGLLLRSTTAYVLIWCSRLKLWPTACYNSKLLIISFRNPIFIFSPAVSKWIASCSSWTPEYIKVVTSQFTSIFKRKIIYRFTYRWPHGFALCSQLPNIDNGLIVTNGQLQVLNVTTNDWMKQLY